MTIQIIPKPAKVEPTGGALTVHTPLSLKPRGGADEMVASVAEGSLGYATDRSDVTRSSSIELCIEPALSAEGYVIEIAPTGIRLLASGLPGFRYGLQTVEQLATAGARGPGVATIPCCRIEDAPRFPWRGLMLDSSRHFQSVATIKRVIQQMAELKLNRLHWHLTDDEGWRIEVPRWPRLTEIAAWRGTNGSREGGFYTRAEMREVEDYAEARGIVVIPEVEMPGHCNAALHAYPELSCGGERLPMGDSGWDAYTKLAGRRVFCAGQDAVGRFLRDVLDEVTSVFRSPYIHLGGDERPSGLWAGCRDCRELMERHGGGDERSLHARFMDEITEYAHRACLRQSIGWADRPLQHAPAGQIVQGWHPGQSAAAARLGRDTINSNHEWTYLDYPSTEAGRKSKPDWMIVLPLEKVYHFEPIPDGLEPELHHRVLGSEMALWTEYVPNERALFEHLLPRLVAFSEVLWSPRDGRSYDDFQSRLNAWRGSEARPVPQIDARVSEWALAHRDRGAAVG